MEHGVLDDFFGFVGVSRDVYKRVVQPVLVFTHQLLERLGLPGERICDQLLVFVQSLFGPLDGRASKKVPTECNLEFSE